MILPDDLRAATLTQPWAGLVASGIKPIENRDRNIAGKHLFGQTIAIHASREIDEDVYARIMELDDGIGSCTYIDSSDGMLVQAIATDSRWYKLSRVTSAIVGVATLKHKLVGWNADSIREHKDALDQQLEIFLGPGKWLRWMFGPVAYILTDIVALPEPVPCKGRLGFWPVPPPVRAEMQIQLRGVA